MNRLTQDKYYTSQKLVNVLLENLPEVPWSTFKGLIFEPCDGEQAISKVLKERCNEATIITNEPYPTEDSNPQYSLDATNLKTWEQIDSNPGFRLIEWTITNPPYKLATPILKNALCYSKNVAMLLRLSYLEPTKDRASLLERHPPDKIIILNPRPRFRTDTKGSDSVTSAWLIWRQYTNTENTEIVYATDWNK
jgi:hypothetical protein